MKQKFTLKITCQDVKVLVYKISKILLENHLNITRNDEFVDKEKNLFFMRTEFLGSCNLEEISRSVTEILPQNAVVKVFADKIKNVVILVRGTSLSF